MLEPGWLNIKAKPDSALSVLEWSRTMLAYCRATGNLTLATEFEPRIRD